MSFFGIKAVMELLTCRVPLEVKNKLEEIAKRVDRPVSNLLRLIVIDFVASHEKDPSIAAFVHMLAEQNKSSE